MGMDGDIEMTWGLTWGFGNEQSGTTVREGVVVAGHRMCLECEKGVLPGERVAMLEDDDDGYVAWVHVACLPSEVARARAVAVSLLGAN